MAGALFVFLLVAWREKRKERITREEKFKTGIFILVLQREFLLNLRAELQPYRDHPIRAYAILPFTYVVPEETLRTEALAFLLVTGESELLHYITFAQAKFRFVVALVSARNDAHLKFQQRLEASQQVSSVSEEPLDDIRRIAGRSVSATLEQLTEGLIRDVDDAIAFNRDVITRAVASFKRLFPRAGMFAITEEPDVTGAATSKGGKDTTR